MMERTPRPASPEAAYWWTTERAQAVALLLALALLETLPIEAWQVALAGVSGTFTRLAVPLWYLVGIVLLADVIGRWLHGRGVARAALASAPLALAAYLVLLRISPAAYGDAPGGLFSLGWLSALVSDLRAGNVQLIALFWLAVLTAYLWWRGLLLGAEPPAMFQVVRRFAIGTTVLILAVIVGGGATAEARAEVSAALTLLLPAQIFSGLAACALARIAQHREQHPDENPGAETQARWLGTALGAAALLVGFTLLLSLVINASDVAAALGVLGPVGRLIDGAVRGLVNGLGALLSHIFGTGTPQHFSVPRQPPRDGPGPPSVCVPTTTQPCLKSAPGALSPFWQHVALALVQLTGIAVIVLIFVYVLRQLVLRQRMASREEGWEDVTESLDGRTLLRAQLRGLFARHHGEVAPAGEALAAGSVRALYRDLLEAAARRDLGRATAETPDEYALRLGHALPPEAGGASGGAEEEDDDVRALTAAYDAARYGEREADAGMRRTLARVAARLTRRLRESNSSSSHTVAE
jgi:uncharacterized protein DUF4129